MSGAPRRTRGIAVLAGALIAAGAVAAAVAAGARGPDPNAAPSAPEVEARVMSPFCPGLTLSECPSTQAGELRSRVAEMTSAGWSNRRIDAWVRANYGEAAIARPSGVLVWIAPALVLLAGAAGLATVLRRAPAGPPHEDAPEISTRERRILDEELRAFAGESTE